MGYREFSGDLDGASQRARTSYVEFDGQLDDPARRSLPSWTAPSKAGAGRGFVNPPAVEPPGLLDRATSALQGMLGLDDEASGGTRSRGGLRSEVKPFVGGDERIERLAPEDGVSPDPLARAKTPEPSEPAQWQIDAEYLSRSPESQRLDQAARTYEARIANAPRVGPGPARRGVDVAAETVRDVVDVGGSRTLAGQAAGKATQVAGDLTLSSLRIIPETLQLANDILQLGTGGLTQGFSRVMEATGNVIGEQQSTKLANEHAALMSVMRDPDAGPSEVARFLLAHPEYSLNAALPSVGSMAIGAGGGRLGANFARALAARRGAVGAEIAAATDRGAAIGATAANAAMNAGSTFDQTRGDLADKYLAAGIAGAGTAAAGKFFDGGAEAMLARGAVATSRPAAVAGTAIKEAGQEASESLSQGVGQAVGEDRSLDPNALAKQATLEGSLGGLIGGGAGMSVAVGGQERTAEQLARSKGFLRPVERARAIDDRVDDFGVTHGVSAKAVQAAKAEAAKLPLEDRVPYLKRVMAAYQRNGLVGRQFDDAALTLLDESPEPPSHALPATPASPTRVAPGSAPSIEQQMADRLAQRFGIGSEFEAPAGEASGNAVPDSKTFIGNLVPAANPASRSRDDTALTPLDASAHEAATSPTNGRPEPTDAQKEAGNYKVGRVRIDGMNVSIENPKGSVRRSKADAPTPWEVTMPAHYGYIRGTNGADGDHVDLFIGDRGENGRYWVINQNQPDSKKFDEHKVITGVDSSDEAIDLYKRSFADGFGDKVFASVSGEFDANGIKAKLPSMSKARAVEGGAQPTAAPPSVEAAPVAAAPDEQVDDTTDPFKLDKRTLNERLDAIVEAGDAPDLVRAFTVLRRRYEQATGKKSIPPPGSRYQPLPDEPLAAAKPVAAVPFAPPRVGNLIETWTGTQKKGMLIHAAQSQMRDQQKRRPDLQWSIVPAPEFAEDRFKLVGREPVAEFAVGDRISIDGSAATVQKVAKAHIVATEDGGKKRTIAFDSPTMEKVRAARAAAPVTAAPALAAQPEQKRKSTKAPKAAKPAVVESDSAAAAEETMASRAEAAQQADAAPVSQPAAEEKAPQQDGKPFATKEDQPAAEETKQDEAGNVAMMSRRSPQPFYSELTRQVEKAVMNAASPAAWQSWLKGLPQRGVKPDEIEWSGLPEWLDMQQGKVTKAAVLGYLNANGVRVEETVLSDAASTAERARLHDESDRIRDELEAAGYDLTTDMDGTLVSVTRRGEEQTEFEYDGERWVPADDADGEPMPDNISALATRYGALAEELVGDERPAASTKYSSYTLPGGTSYREVLLTLPEDSGAKARKLAELDAEATRLERAGDSRWRDVSRERGELLREQSRQTYRSPHWDQPNILAHIRLNDRTDADGKRVLFVEEIQSDWAQQGKKRGFMADDAERAAIEAEYQASKDAWDAAARAGQDVTEARERHVMALAAYNARINDAKTPSAPFVGKTDAWVALALKRVIKMAVDEGYDRVAFVTGEQSAERYDLSKQVDSVTYSDDGVLRAFQGRNAVITRNAKPEELADLIGKEPAERLMKQPSEDGYRTLSGEQLKIGGEGMRAFYDKIVPSVLKDVLRKVGGTQVGTADIGKSDIAYRVEPNGIAKGAQAGKVVLVANDSDTVDRYWAGGDSWVERKSLAMNVGEAEARAKIESIRAATAGVQPAFDITDSMREKAARGMPLFSRRYADRKKTTPATESFQPQVAGLPGEQGPAPNPLRLPDSALQNKPGTGRITTEKQLAGYRRGDPDSARMSAGGAGRGVTMRDADAAVALIREAMPKAPPIVVVEDLRKAPAELLRLIRAAGAEHDIEAAYHAGKVYVFPSRIESIERLMFVVGRHELRHYGFDAMLGPKRAQVMLGIGMKNPALMERAKAVQAQGKATNLTRAIEEALADMPVDEVAKLSGFDRMLSLVRQWLREMAATLREKGWTALADAIEPQAWTDNDIAAFVSKAEDVSRRGVRSVATGGTMMSRAGVTDTPEFKRWFGDSKVVDAQGKPLVVYHGTVASFDAFDPDAEPISYESDRGMQFFTSSAQAAGEYAGHDAWGPRHGANVMPVYLKIERPFETHVVGDPVSEWDGAGRLLRRLADDRDADGVIIHSDDTGEKMFVTFDPTQIKSATGNRGRFDATNPDIRMSVDAAASRDDTARYAADPDRNNLRVVDFAREQIAERRPGFLLRAVEAPGDRSDLRAARAFARRIAGHEAVFVRQDGERVFNGVAFGSPGSNYVLIDVDSPRPVMAVLGHEMLHRLRGARPDLYDVLERRLSGVLRNEGAYRDRINGRYDELGLKPLSDDAIHEELIADVFGDEWNDPAFWRAVAGDKPSGLRAVLDQLVRILDGLLAKAARIRPFGTDEYLADMQAARDAIAEATREFSRGEVGEMAEPAGELKFSAHTPEQKKALARAGIGGLPPQAESEGHELPGESPARWFQRKTQDGLNRFTVLREWAVDHGLAMSPDSNVWAFEERMHGRVATRVEDFRERRLQPLVKSIQAAGFTMDEVAQYLHAQHAEERNRQIEKIDPDNKAGSGMSTQDAAEILASADPKLAALANEVRSITDDTRRILLEAGIISGEMADAWQATYKHYVPLKGDAQAQTGIGKGLSVNGRQHRALGHGERDERIVENILRDHERAILLAEKNTVGHALLAFITELANDEIATVGKPQKRKALLNSTDYEVVNRNGDSVATFDSLQAANAFIRARGSDGLTTRPVKGDAHVAFTSSPALADNEVQVYVKGHAVRVQLNDPILARAYRGIGVERLNQLMALNRQVNTWLSKAYTGLNPEFLLVNITRDFSTGLINIIGNYGVGVAAKAVVNYPKSFAAVLRYSFGGEATPALKAYRDAGGSTGAAYLSDLERVGLDVQHAYDQYQGVLATLKDGRPTAALMTANRKLLGAFAGWVEHLNAAGENAMRLAVFDALRSTDGYTVNDAASAAKNATVNFNRKGEWGQVLNSMYLFYNANVQGTAAMADALVHGKHRRQAWAVLAMLPAAAFALASAQFDEDEWRRIPDYVKSRNIIIRTGRKTYATLPIPYGYGWFWSLGNAMVDLRHGRSIDKVALNIANGLLENFSPVNPLGDTLDPRGMVELLPGAVGGELMRAGARLAVNRSGLGRDIVPDSKFDENRPDSLRMWRSTKGTLADKAASALNRWTGGTKTQAGGIDVSPETLKYWAATVTGGAGTFVSDTVGLAGLGLRYVATNDEKKAAALAPELREIPIVRKFVRQEDIRDARAAYWDAVKEAKDAVADFERARKAHDAVGQAQTRAKANLLKPMAKMADATNKLIKARRERIETIMADENKSLGQKRVAMRVVEAEEQRLYDKYVSVFDAKMRKAASRTETPREPAEVAP